MSQDYYVGKPKVNGGGVRPQVMLNKLRFDLRNAKPAFLDVSYCKLEGSRTQPVTQQTKVNYGESNGQVHRDQDYELDSRIDASGAGVVEIYKTGRPVAGSAVQVNDGDSEGLAGVSNASQLHRCAAASESTDIEHKLPPVTTECMQSADVLSPSCSVPQDKRLPTSRTSSSSLMLPSIFQTNTLTYFYRCKQQAGKPKWTDCDIADSKTAVGFAESKVFTPSSVLASESYSRKRSTELALHSTSHDNVELPGGGKYSESSVHSRSLSIFHFGDDSGHVTLNDRSISLHPTSRVRKSLRSKTVHNLRTATATSIKDECEFKHNKRKVVQTRKRRRMIKSEPEDDDWSTRKKLLIMPVDEKFSKSGRRRRRNARTKRNIFALMPKRRSRRSVCAKVTELPDLGATTLDTDVADVSDILMKYDWESDVDTNAVSPSVSRKWCLDITGADLTTDLDIDCKQIVESSDQQKSSVWDKTDEQNVGQVLPKYATDAECCHTNFSTSQETPPPSVDSDGFSSCDEHGQPDQSVDHGSDAEEEERHEASDIRRLYIGTQVAHYIDGRHFDRLVNGISVRMSAATLTEEAVAQIGQECLLLSQLTKRDVKELQDQVRLEEIYYRRAKKAVFALHRGSNKRVKHIGPRKRKASDLMPRSAVEFAAKSQKTDNNGNESECAQAGAANQQGASSELCPFAAESDDSTLPYLSSDDDDIAKSNNPISRPEGMYTCELLKGNVADTSQGADRSRINIDGATQQEVAGMSIPVRIRRLVSTGKKQSRAPDLHGEPARVSVSSQQLTSSPGKRTASDTVDVSNSHVIDDYSKDVSQQNVASSRKRNIVRSPVVSMRRAVVDADTAKTDVSHTDTASADDTEYIAAVALTLLSVSPESQLHSPCQSDPPESEVCIEAALDRCQTDEKRKSTQRDTEVAVNAKPAHHCSPHHSTKQTSLGETVTETSFVKPSCHTVTRNGRHLRDGERKCRHVSASGEHKHTSKSVGDVSEHTVSTSKSQRSRDRTSHLAERVGHHKRVSEGEEKLSVTCAPKSTVNSDRGSSHVSTNSVNTKNAEVSKNNNCETGGKTEHRKHGSRSHHSSSSSSGSSSSKQTMVDSDRHVTDVNAGGSDMPARGGNALPFNGTVTPCSADNSKSSGTICSSSRSLSASHSVIHSDGIVKPPLGKVSRGEKFSMNSEKRSVTTTTSLPSTSPYPEPVAGTRVHRVFSDLNSNTLKKSHTSSGDNDRHRGDADVAQIMSDNADTDAAMSAIADNEVTAHSRSVTKNTDETVYSDAPNWSSESLVADAAKSPTSPYRESEDIRSPSPMPADPEKEDRAEGIRSPSPSDMESPAALFHVVETSWDVRLTSPCEIQSPDMSEDEAADGVDEFDRQCNVCFQHGPVTIPLTIEEAITRTHNQQPDDT